MEMKNFYRPCCNVGNEEYISSNLNLDLTYATREKKWYFLKGNGISSHHPPSTNIRIHSFNRFFLNIYSMPGIFLGTEDTPVNKIGKYHYHH